MKFGINIDISEYSMNFLERAVEKLSFCSNIEFYCFFVCEMEEQIKEKEEIKKRLDLFFKKKNIKYKLILDSGDVLTRTLNLIKENNLNFFIAAYEHTILGSSFFENLVKEIEIPLIIIK